MTEDKALTILRGNDPEQAARAATALWQMWHQSGDPKLDALLLEGIEAMQRHELREADEVFTRLIETAPRFAEGWNKRATVNYAGARRTALGGKRSFDYASDSALRADLGSSIGTK